MRAANPRARTARMWHRLHRSCVSGGTRVHSHERPHVAHVCATAAPTAALRPAALAAARARARVPPAILPKALGPPAKIASSSAAIVSKSADADTAVDIDAIADSMSRASTNR